jgi:hypothetical protein
MPEDIETFSQVLRELMASPKKLQAFMEQETTEKVCRDLQISGKMATELKNILMILMTKQPSGVGPSPAPAEKLEDKAIETVTSAEAFLERSFRQLRTGAEVLMYMSVTMFLLGVGFLVIAAIRSFTNPESAEVTGVIAGVGVVQIVFLFYRNPLRDIGRTISNSQQSKMVVMSYMLGVSLIAKSLNGKATEKEQCALSAFTQQALEQLDQLTEGKIEKSAKGPRKAARQTRKFRGEGIPAAGAR